MPSHHTRRYKKHKRRNNRNKTHRGRRVGGLNTENTNAQIELQTKLANPSDRQRAALKTACNEPNNCMAIGQYIDLINVYFEQFKNLNLVTSAVTIISKGANGAVFKIPFTKDGYTAYTALKTSLTRDSDNLGYEYYIGKNFINKLIRRFTCFLETYEMYKFSRPLAAVAGVDPDLVKKIVPIKHTTWGETCKLNKDISVNIQYFDSCQTLWHIVADKTNNKSLADIWIYLYQMYFALGILGDNYTHYDLHANNILMYKPYGEKEYLELIYHLENGAQLILKTDRITKIIDYGRNYVNFGFVDPGNNTTTKSIIDEVCASRECKPNCGENLGYSILQGESVYPNNGNMKYINSNTPNVSVDLLTAEHLLNAGDMDDVISNVLYPRNTIRFAVHPFETKHATPNNIQKNVRTRSGKPYVYNVSGMKEAFEEILPTLTEEYYKTAAGDVKYDVDWKCVAKMNIYSDDREYEIIDTRVFAAQSDATATTTPVADTASPPGIEMQPLNLPN